MSTGLLALTALVGAASAQDYASEPQELYFEDVYDVFSVVSFDTGHLPSPGDPITVRFHITPTGGVVTAMEMAARTVEGKTVVGEVLREAESQMQSRVKVVITDAGSLRSEAQGCGYRSEGRCACLTAVSWH